VNIFSAKEGLAVASRPVNNLPALPRTYSLTCPDCHSVIASNDHDEMMVRFWEHLNHCPRLNRGPAVTAFPNGRWT